MGVSDEPVVNKIADAGSNVGNVFSQWWNLTTAERRPQPDAARMVTVDQLPIYGEDVPARPLQFIEEEPLPLEREFATFRKTFNEEYQRVADRFSFVDTAVNHTTNTVANVKRYVEDEWSVLPKAGAITLGGMAGFVLGMKRGGFGRVVGSATGLATMAAFCYPHETVDVVRSGASAAGSKWNEFQESPVPEAKKKPDLSPPKH